jgi:hypothetical protein
MLRGAQAPQPVRGLQSATDLSDPDSVAESVEDALGPAAQAAADIEGYRPAHNQDEAIDNTAAQNVHAVCAEPAMDQDDAGAKKKKKKRRPKQQREQQSKGGEPQVEPSELAADFNQAIAAFNIKRSSMQAAQLGPAPEQKSVLSSSAKDQTKEAKPAEQGMEHLPQAAAKDMTGVSTEKHQKPTTKGAAGQQATTRQSALDSGDGEGKWPRCDRADCRKLLLMPLRCSRCRAVAYCSKECQVCDPPLSQHATHAAHTRCARFEAYTPSVDPHSLPRLICETYSSSTTSGLPLIQTKAWKGGHKLECKALSQAPKHDGCQKCRERMVSHGLVCNVRHDEVFHVR